MFSSLIRKTTSLLLATMLGAIAVAPPAVRHVHPLADEGHVHHRHDASPNGLHRHSHQGDKWDHRHSHHGGQRYGHLAGAHGGGAELAAGHWWHLHYQFLFFEFTLPDSVPDQDDRESYGRDTVSVLTVAREAVSCRAPQTASAWQMIPPSDAVSPEDAALLQVVVTAPPPVSCPPLCDRARRERSGVLIA